MLLNVPAQIIGGAGGGGGSGQATYQSVGNGSGLNVQTINVAYPSGIVSGDVLVAWVGHSGTSSSLTTPSGWTLRGGAGGSTPSTYGDFLTKVADGTETGSLSVSWTNSSTFERWGFIARVSDADIGTVSVGTAAQTGGASSLGVPGVTTPGDGYIAFAGVSFDGGDATAFSWNNSFTTLGTVSRGSGSGASGSLAYKEIPSAGAVGTTTASNSTSDGIAGRMLILGPSV